MATDGVTLILGVKLRVGAVELHATHSGTALLPNTLLVVVHIVVQQAVRLVIVLFARGLSAASEGTGHLLGLGVPLAAADTLKRLGKLAVVLNEDVTAPGGAIAASSLGLFLRVVVGVVLLISLVLLVVKVIGVKSVVPLAILLGGVTLHALSDLTAAHSEAVVSDPLAPRVVVLTGLSLIDVRASLDDRGLVNALLILDLPFTPRVRLAEKLVRAVAEVVTIAGLNVVRDVQTLFVLTVAAAVDTLRLILALLEVLLAGKLSARIVDVGVVVDAGLTIRQHVDVAVVTLLALVLRQRRACRTGGARAGDEVPRGDFLTAAPLAPGTLGALTALLTGLVKAIHVAILG